METTGDFEPIDARSGLILNIQAQSYLREAGKWAAFLGIIGFIFCGLILIPAFFIGSIFAKMAAMSPYPVTVSLAGISGAVTAFHVLVDLIYFFFSLYLYQFGDRIKKSIISADTLYLTAAFGKLKSFFKLWGILTIILLCVCALIIFGIIAVGIGAASMMQR